MPTQGELFDEAAETGNGDLGGAPPERGHREDQLGDVTAPVWLQRISLVILVLFCLYIGVLLTVLPWSPRFWDGNGWLHAHPALRDVLLQGWARGVLSGFGLLDIWIGVSELLHYRDYRSRQATAS